MDTSDSDKDSDEMAYLMVSSRTIDKASASIYTRSFLNHL